MDVGFGSVHRQTMFKALFISIHLFFLPKIQQTEHDLRILSEHSRQPHRTIQWIWINRMKFLNNQNKRNKNMLLSKCISLETFLPFGRRLCVFSSFWLVFCVHYFLSFPNFCTIGHSWALQCCCFTFYSYFFFKILIHFHSQPTSFNFTAG